MTPSIFLLLNALLLAFRASAGRVSSQLKLKMEELESFEEASVRNSTYQGLNSKDPKLEVSPLNTGDSRLADFVMPTFDQVARVRPAQLTAHFKNKDEQPKAIVAKWGEGGAGAISSKAQRGISNQVWSYEKFPVRLKLFEIFKKKSVTDYMTFNDFVEMQSYLVIERNLKTDELTEENENDKKTIKKWLKKNFGYGYLDKAEDLAEAYTTLPYIPVREAALPRVPRKSFNILARFASLDTNHDAKLHYVEVHEALVSKEAELEALGILKGEELREWENVARVEDTDFAGLGFPAAFTKDILATLGSTIKSDVWAAKDLSNVLTEYIKRDKIAENADGKETFSGKLKFFQMADILPGTCGIGGITVKYGDTEKTVSAPTINQLAGMENSSPLLEARASQFKRWLEDKLYQDTGMTRWTGNKYATDTARHATNWGCGMIKVSGVVRLGKINKDKTTKYTTCILAGPKAHKDEHEAVMDQYTDVACRLATFVEFDTVKQGKMIFADALPILYKALRPVTTTTTTTTTISE